MRTQDFIVCGGPLERWTLVVFTPSLRPSRLPGVGFLAQKTVFFYPGCACLLDFDSLLTNCICLPGPPKLPLRSLTRPRELLRFHMRPEPPPKSVWSGCSCLGGPPPCLYSYVWYTEAMATASTPSSPPEQALRASCLWSSAFCSVQDSGW